MNFNKTYLDLHLKFYPAPKLLNYLWSFGGLLGICLSIQILSGFFLTFFYKPNVLEAFISVEKNIMRDIDTGWFVRYLHANGSSFFFFFLYLHICKGIYYMGYLKKKTWKTGLLLFIILMIEAFTGYVLPWGQMSFWAATVITNFFSIIPFIGKYVTEFLWGGFTVSEVTLKRFFSLHFILGFSVFAFVVIHIIVLHDKGSSSPKFENINKKVNFLPLFGEEFFFSVLVFVIFIIFFVFFRSNYFMHPANYEKANSLVTPIHIVPEWYFLPFYTILRIAPGKVSGIILMGLSIIIILILPFFVTKKKKKKKLFFTNFFFLNF